jgi:hypothetical protein
MDRCEAGIITSTKFYLAEGLKKVIFGDYTLEVAKHDQ